MWDKNASEIIKNYAQVIAWIFAAGYFLAKAIQGFFGIDMSVSVTTERTSSSKPGVDYLSISVELHRGDRAALRLHEALVLVRQGSETKPLQMNIERLSFKKSDKLLFLNINKLAVKVPTLNLVPGESMHLGAWTEIDNSIPCTIEVIALGTRFKSARVGQWRASTVSVPRQRTSLSKSETTDD